MALNVVDRQSSVDSNQRAEIPLVSIGLPVYNGENFLAEAIESVLNQTFQDFELIISDNASTDSTEAICRAYAKQDQRIRYHRNDTNLGGGPNSNVVFNLSSGKYFQWISHDDVHAPTLLERCVDVLENSPEVVICHSKVQFIDEQGNFIRNYEKLLKTDSSDPCIRFSELLRPHLCYPIFGLIRAEILRQTPLMGCYSNGDGILLHRLALRGRFYEIPERLFSVRHHPGQSASRFIPNYLECAGAEDVVTSDIQPDYHAYNVWFNSSNEGKLHFPHWRIAWEMWATIRNSPLGVRDRLRCHAAIQRQMRGLENLMVKDLVVAGRQITQPLRGTGS